MSQKRICRTPTCDNQSTPRTDYCKRCGANINLWARRRLSLRIKRKENLALYTGRMNIVIERNK